MEYIRKPQCLAVPLNDGICWIDDDNNIMFCRNYKTKHKFSLIQQPINDYSRIIDLVKFSPFSALALTSQGDLYEILQYGNTEKIMISKSLMHLDICKIYSNSVGIFCFMKNGKVFAITGGANICCAPDMKTTISMHFPPNLTYSITTHDMTDFYSINLQNCQISSYASSLTLIDNDSDDIFVVTHHFDVSKYSKNEYDYCSHFCDKYSDDTIKIYVKNNVIKIDGVNLNVTIENGHLLQSNTGIAILENDNIIYKYKTVFEAYVKKNKIILPDTVQKVISEPCFFNICFRNVTITGDGGLKMIILHDTHSWPIFV